MGILIQLIGFVLAVAAFFMHLGWLFMIVGFVFIFLDLIALFSGKLNPLFPIFLYIGGYIIVGNWTGLLWGAVIGNILEAIPTLIGVGAMPFLKAKEKIKSEKSNNQEQI